MAKIFIAQILTLIYVDLSAIRVIVNGFRTHETSAAVVYWRWSVIMFTFGVLHRRLHSNAAGCNQDTHTLSGVSSISVHRDTTQ